MLDFIKKFRNEKNLNQNLFTNNVEHTTTEVKNDFDKYIERILILENKNIILLKKIDSLERKSNDYEFKYNGLLKASKEEINRLYDARKLLESDPNYKKELERLGLVPKEEYNSHVEKYYQLMDEYDTLKKDYDVLSRKLNNILIANI